MRISAIAVAMAAATAMTGPAPASAEEQDAWLQFSSSGYEQYRRMMKRRPRATAPATAEPSALGAPDPEESNDEQWQGGAKPDVAPVSPQTVAFNSSYGAGTIIIDTSRRKLFYVLSDARAYQYPISVGRQGFQWSGTNTISRVQSWPTWTPPPEMRKRSPNLPKVMSGGVNNPLGAKALYLGATLYRIHGTNNRKSIGRAASSGCFRMLNGHVVHLAGIAKVGTKVVVMKRLPSAIAQSIRKTHDNQDG